MNPTMAALTAAATFLAGATGSAPDTRPAAAHRSLRDNYWWAIEHCGAGGGAHGLIHVCVGHKPATLHIGGPGPGRGGELKITSLRWSRWNGSGAYGHGVLWIHGPNWRREGRATITLDGARQYSMSTGYYSRVYVAPQFRVKHHWKWIWYSSPGPGSFPWTSGKWVVS
jgi:hypothetical protein